MSIERFVVEDSRTASCAPESVMRLLLRPSTWTRWQPEIVSINGPEPLSEGDVSIGRATMLGFHVVGQSRALGRAPRSFTEDVIVGVHIVVHYRIDVGADGVVVTRRLEADLPRGPLGRLLSLFLKRRLRAMQREVLDQLVVESEAAGR